MSSKKLLVAGIAAGATLLVATPLVAQAAAFITSADIVNSTIRSKDVKNGGLKGKDLAANTVTGANVSESSLVGVNADKVDGLDANQLVRATTQTVITDLDDFDAGVFTNVVSRSVTAPTAGIFVISGQLNVNDDITSSDAFTTLRVRGAVDAAAATTEVNVRSDNDGTVADSVHVSGAVAVTAGAHTVSLQALESSTGTAYITERSVTVVFVPFGDAGTQGTLGKMALSGSGGGNN